MKYFYISCYVLLCIILFLLIFMYEESFYFLFEKTWNNITDYNDPNYTGGVSYIFNPFRHFTI